MNHRRVSTALRVAMAVAVSLAGCGRAAKTVAKESDSVTKAALSTTIKAGSRTATEAAARKAATRLTGGAATKVTARLDKVTPAGVFSFANTTGVGRLGDDLTTAHMKRSGAQLLPSKVGEQGLDAVYVAEPEKLMYRVENKVRQNISQGTGALSPDQMSAAWIAKNTERMRTSVNPRVRETASKLDACAASSKCSIKDLLVQWQPETGKGVLRELDSAGQPVGAPSAIDGRPYLKELCGRYRCISP